MSLHQIASTVMAMFLSVPLSSAAAPIPLPKISVDPRAALGGDYVLDPHHTSVTVKLSHMGLSLYTLRFNGVEGRYAYDPMRPTATRVAISIDPKSIDTGDHVFDQSIATRYFEVAKYPVLRFTSIAIKPAGSSGEVSGQLEFHGVKRPITLHVSYHGSTNMEGQQRMGFSAETTFKRSDFGVDAYVPLEGDAVKVLIETEFVRAPKSGA